MNKKAEDWIRAFGPRHLCKEMPAECRVTDSAVYLWLSGARTPTYDRCKALVEIAKRDVITGGSKARLTVEDFRASCYEAPTTTKKTATKKATNA